MALTVAPVVNTVVGNQKMTVSTVTFDSSYPTGGEAMAAADVGLNVIDVCIPYASDGYGVEYDGTNLVAYSAADTEVTDATDLSTLVIQVLCFGS